VTHDDDEVYSSPTKVRGPLAFRMIRYSPVQRANACQLHISKLCKRLVSERKSRQQVRSLFYLYSEVINPTQDLGSLVIPDPN